MSLTAIARSRGTSPSTGPVLVDGCSAVVESAVEDGPSQGPASLPPAPQAASERAAVTARTGWAGWRRMDASYLT